MRVQASSNAMIVYLLYCLSGFVSLGYQVAWFRIFVDRFGSTNLTFVLVVCNFIGGLGLGALVSRRVTEVLSQRLGLDNRLRVYGIIEILIAAASLLTLLCALLPADAWGAFPYELRDGIFRQTAVYQLSKIAIAAGVVFLPCFFMGTTFPLLCHVFHHDERFPAALYGWNTLGACAAVLACAFFFFPAFGYERTFLIMSAINFALGVFFLLKGDAVWIPSETRQERRRSKSDERRSADALPLDPSFLVTCAIISGLLCGAVQGDMFKRLQFLGCVYGESMAFISFWAILAIFLASWTVRAFPRLGVRAIRIAFVMALVCYLATWFFAYPLSDALHGPDRARLLSAAAARRESTAGLKYFPFQYGPRALFLYAGLFVFPTYYLLSLLLPYVCNRFQNARRHLGLAYGANTLAFCIGMIAFTWVAPRVNIFYSTKLIFVLFAILTGLLWLVRARERLVFWKPALAALAFAAGCILTPAGFDRGYFRDGHAAAKYPIRALKSNAAHTTYVVKTPAGDQFYFEDYPMSTMIPSAQKYMRLMAHFPLLAQEEPRSALLICFGVGNTAAAIATHDTVEQIDIVDLNDQVFATAPEFADMNGNVHRDPRVRLIHDDGRNFLNLTDQSYDLITSEPPPPMQEGVYRLYTTEYYAAVLDRLTPQGLMTQWLSVWQLPPEAVELVISTFVDSFPHTLLFIGSSNELILVGGKSPINLRRIEERFFDSPRAVADLSRIGCRVPLSLIIRVVVGERSLRAQYGGHAILSDQYNKLAHIARDPFIRPEIVYDPQAVLEEIQASRLAGYEQLRQLVDSPQWLARVRLTTSLRTRVGDGP